MSQLRQAGGARFEGLPPPPRARWTVAGAVSLATVLVVLLVAFGWRLGPFDLQSFLTAGQRVLDGHSPYDPASSSVFRTGHAFVYPAFVAWVFAPLALLPHGLAEAVYIVASAAAIIAATTLLGRPGFYPAALVFLSSTTIIGLQMGTVNAFLFLGLAGAWRLRSARLPVSGVILGLVAAMKLFLVPIVAWPLLLRRYMTTAAAAATFAALLLAGTVFGPIGLGSYAHLLSKLQGNEAVQSWSLTSFLQSAGLGPTLAEAGAVLVALAFLLVLRIRIARLSDGQVLGMVVLCCLLVSPIVWSSYLLLFAVPLLTATADNRALAITALGSWAVTTPDVATTAGIVAGVTLTVAVGLLATRSELWSARRHLALPSQDRVVGGVVAVAALVAVLIAVPATVRNAMPALVCLAFVAVVGLRAKPDLLRLR